MDDWVMVPREPTPEMCAAGFCVSEAEHDPAGVYRAMLSAAPQQQAEPSEIQHPCDVPGLCAKMNRKCDQCDPQQQAEPVARRWTQAEESALHDAIFKSGKVVSRQQAEHSPVPPEEADAADTTIGLFSLPKIRVDAETYQWLQSQAVLRGLIVQAFVRKTLSAARQQQAQPQRSGITAEQVKQIKRLASLLETQVRSVYLLGDNAAERKEMVADMLETRAALHAALDALVTKETS